MAKPAELSVWVSEESDELLGLLSFRVGGHGLLARCIGLIGLLVCRFGELGLLVCRIGELGLVSFCLSLGEWRVGDSSFETDFNFVVEEDEH